MNLYPSSKDTLVIESPQVASIVLDADAFEKAVWVKPVIEDFNSQVEGGSVGGASDVSVFHS